MRTAIAFSTKDRVELTKQSAPPLLAGARDGQYDMLWVDGSNTEAGERIAHELGNTTPNTIVHHNIRGGADSAIVYALSTLLAHPAHYDVLGIAENDVLVPTNWFAGCARFFETCRADGLEVGAVAPRAYEDRILLQRDGYAVMHNTGAGVVLLTRQAAKLILANYRNAWTMENRRIFCMLSGIDIGRYWAFRGAQQFLTVDWAFDAILARHGLASVAPVPQIAEMIGQDPPLAEQGLKLANQPFELLRDDKAFELFVERTRAVREGRLTIPGGPVHQNGPQTFFSHQIPALGGAYKGDWRLRWAQGFGPFSYAAGTDAKWRELNFPDYSTLPLPSDGVNPVQPSLTVPVYGACSFLVSGGQHGGRVGIEDTVSGYKVAPELPAEGQQTQVAQLMVPASVLQRPVKLTALSPGIVFYGLQTQEPQALVAHEFDWAQLPPV